MEDQKHTNYDHIIDTLVNTFGEVLTRDVMYNIVDSYGGDLQRSANAVMNITMEDYAPGTNSNTVSELNLTEQATISNDQDIYNSSLNREDNCSNLQSTSSYASASKNMSLSINQVKVTTTPTSKPQNFWTDQINRIMEYHENGASTLIIMRGVPGSGKTYLAKKIIDEIYCTTTHQQYHTHIFSTDNYFMCNGVYTYNRQYLEEAHEWNKNKSTRAMIEGVSPIIIDNTNIELWEFKSYVGEGVKNGYIIELVEPNTPWAKKANQLYRKNLHNVPLYSIRKMLYNFESGLSSEYVIKEFGFNYQFDKRPPILRKIPVFPQKITQLPVSSDSQTKCVNKRITLHNCEHDTASRNNLKDNVALPGDREMINPESSMQNMEYKLSADTEISKKFNNLIASLQDVEEIEKKWEKGDSWDDKPQNDSQDSDFSTSKGSKPQRQNRLLRSEKPNKVSSSVSLYQDWNKLSKLLPPWEQNNQIAKSQSILPIVSKVSSSTCIEYGDTNISSTKNPLKIITATSRDINKYHIPNVNNKMPEKWMIDTSTSTNNDEFFQYTFRCHNEEKHFKAFRKLFKDVPKAHLREIFEVCLGDVNWAVETVINDISKKNISYNNDCCSDTESDNDDNNVEICLCSSAYGVVPNPNESSLLSVVQNNDNSKEYEPSAMKKGRKENVVSDTSIQLKRQIEQNVVISDNYYSEHSLKIRKIRRGEYESNEPIKHIDEINTTELVEKHLIENNEPTTTNILQNSTELSEVSHWDTPSTSKVENVICDNDSLPTFDDVEIEKTQNINIGKELISQLDKLFGRSNWPYPHNIEPRINMPMSLLNEINALWMESVMFQMEDNAKQCDIMVQQDEEFAKELATKEAELSQDGKEPEVPDFKEIMDMDLALSLYKKDVEEWRNNMPVDMAAKLTREKLYNLFPEISPDTLAEVLMAHDNNFKSTVEVLLISMGKSDIITEKNGISKFVMEREMERKQKLIEEEKQALSEVEWPLLPKYEKAEMNQVNQYREDAEKHLLSRNLCYQKAQDYIRRGITGAASFYSNIAAYHKRKYEQANSMAAATLLQVHAANCSDNSTIDLHYLRVGEAKESVDLFIDTHIQKLKELQGSSPVKYHTLYFITGRGLHSNGKPRIKPAVMKRLQERGLAFSERNPGLITAKVCGDDKLSYQIA